MNVVICSFFPLISPFEHAFYLEQLSEQQFCSSRRKKVGKIKFSQQYWCNMEQQRPLCLKQENVGLICAYPLHKNSNANKGKAQNCCLAEQVFLFNFPTQEDGTEALHYIENALNIIYFNVAYDYGLQILYTQIQTPVLWT